ncbi:hypothetical protein D3C74_125200 [compost metagenome]
MGLFGTAHVHYLHARGAHDAFTLKGNQPKLQDELLQIHWAGTTYGPGIEA